MSRFRRLRKTVGRCLEKGWWVVPVPPREKAPIIKGWQNLRIERSEITRYFSEDSNVGFLTGEPSGGLMDVDIDCPEALELANEFLPYTGRVHGRRSKPRSHRWYLADPIPAPEKFCDMDGTCLLELRSTGQQTIVPPSIHPSGERIEWETRKRPSKVDGPELRSAVARLAAATLFARHWPSQGSRNVAAMALAGMLIRAGWDYLEVSDIVAAIARAAEDEEWATRKAVARATKKRLEKDEPATGRQRLAEIVGAEVVNRACQWLGIESVRTWSPRLNQNKVPWPEPLAEEALYGLAGDAVRAIAPQTEGDPAALLIQLIVGFGNLIGRNPNFEIGATRHYTNLFSGVVGKTSKSRKGTSWNEVFRLLRDIDPEWARNRKMPGGLSSGEGLIWAVRDPKDEAREEVGTDPQQATDTAVEDVFAAKERESRNKDQGVDDKRLLVVEPEFASTLRVMRRESNILSGVIRSAWDSGDLNNLTKNSPARATGAHVSLNVHITQDELRRELTTTDTANGFANRFLWVCARRSQLLPFGGDIDAAVLKKLGRRLDFAATFARNAQQMRMSKQARKLWRKTYPVLAADVPGLLGAVTSRAEPQVIRLSMVYALLDCSRFIDTCHLSAALAVWRYCDASARYIFGDAIGDPTADAILRELRQQSNGLTRNEIREFFGRNRSEAEISRALNFLLETGWVGCAPEQTGGRPAERWAATR
jgi:Bifunctional DNA primase/polymerase, N-terminal